MEGLHLDPESLLMDSKMNELIGRVVTMLLLSGNRSAILNHRNQGVGKIYKFQQAMGLLPPMTAKPKKSDEEAQKLRIRGNQAYKVKDLMEAQQLYTKAICWAEKEGEEIAMAHANRSAVTFELQEFQCSIEDIDRALSTNKYPKNLMQKLFERRGKCYLALSQFQRASDDFKQAIILLMNLELDADKVTSIRAYLDLLVECLGKQDVPTASTETSPKLTHGPSSVIQCASAAVEIKFSIEMGRHIVATTDIAPGDILSVEKPFASVLCHDYRYLYCNNCMRRCYSSIPCPSCINVVYCSDFCEEVGWKTFHSVECDILHDLIKLGCMEDLMLAIRMLLKSTKLGENMHTFMDDSLNEPVASSEPEKAGFVNSMYISDHYISTHHLLTHMERRSTQQLLQVSVAACSLVHMLKEATAFFEESDSCIPSAALFTPVSDLQWNHTVAADLLIRYIHVLSINGLFTHEVTYRVKKEELKIGPKMIGNAIYPFYSLMNHSCDPDVNLIHFNGYYTAMIAIKPIKKGQQIMASYGFHYANKDLHMRQSVLRSHFHFSCKCRACLEDWPTLLALPERPAFVSRRAKKNHGTEIELFCSSHLPKILADWEKGLLTEKHLQCLKYYLNLIHKCIKRPWKIDHVSQEVIVAYFCHSLNPHTLKGTFKKADRA